MRIVLIHGFNVRDKGARSIDTLAPLFREFGHEVDTDSADYGFQWLVKVRFGFLHYEAIQRITCAIAAADAVVTHSNGANYFNQAANLLAGIWPEKKLLVAHVSPALDESAPFPDNVDHAWVLYTSHDLPVKFARVLRGHPWGAMGAYGPKPVPPNVTPIDCEYSLGHSDYFRLESSRRITATTIERGFREYLEAA